MPLPNREYYPIEKEAKKLNCDIDDLIHFIAMNKMNFWLNIYIYETLYFSDNQPKEWSYSYDEDEDEDEDEYEYEDEDEDGFVYLNKENSITISAANIQHSLNHSEETFFEDKKELSTSFSEWRNYVDGNDLCKLKVIPSKNLEPQKGYPESINIAISGLMNTTGTIIEMEHLTHYTNESIEINFLVISMPCKDEYSNNIYICFRNRKIAINDIYISQDEMELISNGGRSRLQPFNKKEAISSHSTKTQNSQAKVIKALIEVIGGKHAANHPRNAIDNPNSELNKTLDRAGVKLPASGVTVEKWLKGID
ncbi:hypothetical protein RZ418_003908 [Salmonella enterica]|nr:hypothetical protein [Salmonella enterica]